MITMKRSGPFDLAEEKKSKKKKTGQDLSIAPIETSKDLIQQPELAKDENMWIPPLGSSVIICGKSGSGKSTLLANLLLDERFYGKSPAKPKGWFDKIFLFSPTANGDDVQKSLKIPKSQVFTDLEDAGELLDTILDSQQKKLDEAEGAHKVGQYAILFDDVIGDTKFMSEKAFSRCFYQVRHANCTTFINTQHFMRVPKVCRLQANFVFFFAGSLAEVNMITDEYAPPMVSRRDFMNLVNDATTEAYTFLTVNNKVPSAIRFRQNLGEIIQLPASRYGRSAVVGGGGDINPQDTVREIDPTKSDGNDESEDAESEPVPNKRGSNPSSSSSGSGVRVNPKPGVRVKPKPEVKVKPEPRSKQR